MNSVGASFGWAAGVARKGTVHRMHDLFDSMSVLREEFCCNVVVSEVLTKLVVSSEQ